METRGRREEGSTIKHIRVFTQSTRRNTVVKQSVHPLISRKKKSADRFYGYTPLAPFPREEEKKEDAGVAVTRTTKMHPRNAGVLQPLHTSKHWFVQELWPAANKTKLNHTSWPSINELLESLQLTVKASFHRTFYRLFPSCGDKYGGSLESGQNKQRWKRS